MSCAIADFLHILILLKISASVSDLAMPGEGAALSLWRGFLFQEGLKTVGLAVHQQLTNLAIKLHVESTVILQHSMLFTVRMK